MRKTDYVLYLRKGSRTYYVAFYVPLGDGQRKRVYRSTGLTDKNKAKQLCERNLARIGLPMPLDVKGTLFKDFSRDFFDYGTSPYIKRRLKREKKKKKIGHDWADTCQRRLDKYLIPYWGEYDLKEIKPCQINEWLDGLYDSCASGTVVQIFNNFKTILNEAVRRGRIEKNPCLDNIVEKPTKGEPKERNHLPQRIVEVLFHPESLRKLWNNEKVQYTANLLSAYTGMRLGEIMGLQVENIRGTEEEPFLVVENSYSKNYGLKDTKTHETRLVPIHPQLLQLLNEIKPESGFVFSLDGGATPIKEGIRRALYRALERFGISKEVRKAHNVVFHSWRYYCNTMLLEEGMPEAGVRAIIGHRTKQMTERYSKLDGRAFGRRVQEIQERMVDLGA